MWAAGGSCASSTRRGTPSTTRRSSTRSRAPSWSAMRPATPPPDFDLEQSVASLQRFRSLAPTRLVLTHYGPVPDPQVILAEAEEALHRWVARAEQVRRESPGAGVEEVAAALADSFATPPVGVPEQARRKFEILNGVHSNAAGIVRYLEKRAQAETPR